MKKVQIYIKEYGYGGIEKQTTILANALCNIYNIEIVVLGKVKVQNNDLNKKVKITELGIKNDNNYLLKMKIHNTLKKGMK